MMKFKNYVQIVPTNYFNLYLITKLIGKIYLIWIN
jgi:hypothetical protein